MSTNGCMYSNAPTKPAQAMKRAAAAARDHAPGGGARNGAGGRRSRNAEKDDCHCEPGRAEAKTRNRVRCPMDPQINPRKAYGQHDGYRHDCDCGPRFPGLHPINREPPDQAVETYRHEGVTARKARALLGTCMGMFLSMVFFASIHGLVRLGARRFVTKTTTLGQRAQDRTLRLRSSRASMPRGACQVRDMLSRTCMRRVLRPVP